MTQAMDPASREVMQRGGFHHQFDFQIDKYELGLVVARVPFGQHLTQPMGVVHGGVYSSIAESLTSMGTASAVLEDGSMILGMSNNTTFLRPIAGGEIHATAEAIHQGRTTWIWEVSMRDDQGKLCAQSMATVAIRPMSQ